MLISMCSCAPGYFLLDIFSIFRVIALDFLKFCDFQLVLLFRGFKGGDSPSHRQEDFGQVTGLK
jgi:hypothetical protein